MAPRISAREAWISLGLLAVCAKTDEISPNSHGFIGYGIDYYNPECAFACLGSVAAPLNCTAEELAPTTELRKREETSEVPIYPSGDGWNVTLEVTLACQANNKFYLQTVAYCLDARCGGLLVSKLEEFWEQQIPKKQDGTQDSYIQVLNDIKQKPTRQINVTEHLNYTAIVPDDLYGVAGNNIRGAVINEINHETYSLILFVTGAALPIALSLVRFFPWPATWVTRFNAYLIDPPLFGRKHSTPVLGLAIMPTRGQTLFIAYLWLINIFLSVFGYQVIMPNSWYGTAEVQLKRYIANRLGVLCYANVPLVILYAGRNNVLIWLTNWSHSTFLLIHRWMAFICLVHGITHALVYLNVAQTGDGWAEEFTAPYWTYGAIAVVFFAVLCVGSIQPVRQRLYEVFLITHIVVTIVALIAAYKHVTLKYGSTWGFQNWLFISVGIWGFDRVVRLGRIIRGGLRRAHYTRIDDEYYRLDVPGVSAEGHVYLHFPTISKWRFWESHPFSVAAVTHGKDAMQTSGDEQSVREKDTGNVVSAPVRSSGSTVDTEISTTRQKGLGMVVFIRKQGGLTSLLTRKGDCPKGIPVFVEGSYNQGVTFLQEPEATPSHEFPNLICIAGGVGITGVLPSLGRYTHVGQAVGCKKLLWGVRTWPLVHEVENMLGYGGSDALAASRQWDSTDVTLAVDERLDLRGILTRELRSQSGGTTVVVCGPASMVDDARCIISALARHCEGGKALQVRLLIESFTW